MKYDELTIIGLPKSFKIYKAIDYLYPNGEPDNSEEVLYDEYFEEGDEGEDRSGEALQLSHGNTLLKGEEAEGGEDADSSKELKPRVGERDHKAGRGEIGTPFAIGGVGDHDPERDRQREEHLAVGGDPHVRITQCSPVRGEQGVEAVHGAVEEEGPDHQSSER